MTSEQVSFLDCWIPLWGACCGVTTISIVYHLTDFPAGMVTPPISLLGCRYPEHTWYQVGFSITGLLLGYCVLIVYSRHFYPTIQQYSFGLAWSSWLGGILAVVGLIGQGLVTLHTDFLQNIASGGTGLTRQDVWHQQLALLFFVGAALHTYTTCWYSYRVNTPAAIKTSSSINNSIGGTKDSSVSTTQLPLLSRASRILKTLCVVISLLAVPIAEYNHPSRLYTADNGKSVSFNIRIMNVFGLTQYVAVGAYICFFGSYSLDLYVMRRWQQQQQQQQQHVIVKQD